MKRTKRELEAIKEWRKVDRYDRDHLLRYLVDEANDAEGIIGEPACRANLAAVELLASIDRVSGWNHDC